MGKQSKVEKAIRASRKRLDVGDYISAVKEVRKRYPERGLRDSKNFTDWVRSNEEENATDLAGTWCGECWDIFPCEHSRRPAQPMTADTGTPAAYRNDGTPVSLEELLGNADGAKPPSPTRERRKPVCKCGDPTCANPWHSLARWLEQPGNSAKLHAWLRGEQVEGVPLEWVNESKVRPKKIKE
jgi:hypothetical protein